MQRADILLDRLGVEDLAGSGDELGELRGIGCLVALDSHLDDAIRLVPGGTGGPRGAGGSRWITDVRQRCLGNGPRAGGSPAGDRRHEAAGPGGRHLQQGTQASHVVSIRWKGGCDELGRNSGGSRWITRRKLSAGQLPRAGRGNSAGEPLPAVLAQPPILD